MQRYGEVLDRTYASGIAVTPDRLRFDLLIRAGKDETLQRIRRYCQHARAREREVTSEEMTLNDALKKRSLSVLR